MSHFSQDLALCFGGAKGAELKRAYERRMAETPGALDWVRGTSSADLNAIKSAVNATSDLDEAQGVAAHLTKNTSDIVVLGIGGSSLGAQALAQIAYWGTAAYLPKAGTPRIHFVDNMDGATYAALLKGCDLKTTRFLAVSKSGSTAEPLMQVLAAIEALEGAGGGKYLKYHFAGIAEEGGNALRALLTSIGAPLLPHDNKLGGRFSVFSTVGMLPAMLMGLDPAAIRAGARAVLAADGPATQGAALSVAANDVGLSQSVMWAYSDRLERLVMWWRQIWAESLGKGGHGTTPIRALGPVDQHSQLQLYLDGPADKLFTFIDTPHETQDAKANAARAREHGLDLYAGRGMNEVVAAQSRASAETLAAAGRPVRRFALSAALDERGMGALMMQFLLETLIAARLWHVDPFGQPAVEQGKVLTRKYLAGR